VVAVILATAVLAVCGQEQSMVATAGVCPDTTGMVGACVEDCSSDDGCKEQGTMCCSNGCGHVCMVPEVPGQAADGRKCVLKVTLAESEGANTKAGILRSVCAVMGMCGEKKAPSVYDVLKKAKARNPIVWSPLGILLLHYEDSSACCSAQRALQTVPDTAKIVEYDGPKPSCALPSSTGANDVHAAEAEASMDAAAKEGPQLAEVEQEERSFTFYA